MLDLFKKVQQYKFFIPLVFLILVSSSVFAINLVQDYNNPLTRSIADSLYCLLNGCTIAGDLIIEGDLTIIGDIRNVTTLNVNGSLLPSIDDTFDVGSSSFRWQDGFFSNDITALRFIGELKDGFRNENFSTRLNTFMDGSSNEVMTLEQLGNVGIGTKNPETLLHLNATGATVLTLTAGASSIAQIQFGDAADTNAGRIDFDNSDNSLTFLTTDTRHMTILDSGNVGIGTSSPLQTLVVVGTVNITDSLNVTNNIEAGGFFIGDGSLLTGVTADFTNGTDINVTNFVANNTLFVNGSRVGIGTNSPSDKLDLRGNMILDRTNEAANPRITFAHNDVGSDNYIEYSRTNDAFEITSANFLTMTIKGGNVGIRNANPAAKLHVDQTSTTETIPVLYLDQADISEEMIEFATTIGTGNAIEAIGAKTLTTTHFIKVTIPRGLTRYIPIGTIS